MAALLGLAVPCAALALPVLGDVYLGAGARSLGGTPGVSKEGDVRIAMTLEAGVDDLRLVRNWGVGVRADLGPGTKRLAAEIRYVLVQFVGVKVLAGGELGLTGNKGALDGSFGAFVAGRLVLGFPYLGAQFGIYRTPGGNATVSSSAMLTGGVSF
ncbi:MAG: hypothetical protein FJ100_09850 [Deltaproteobacteria bacterium]|nr:hypothetical protein [Deltaproteobacteria bacterium]